MVIWTAKSFELAARRLVHVASGPSSSPARWQVLDENDNFCLLLRINGSALNSLKTLSKDDSYRAGGEWIDETITIDRDSSISMHTSITTETEWTFTIAYSDTWQMPVLYMQVQDCSGVPLTRNQVAALLPSNTANFHDDKSYDFVSCDEHPISGHPCCFLHPCRTGYCLQTLQKSGPSVNSNGAVLLLQWMALILPSVGLSVAASDFCGLLSHLTEKLQQDHIE